MVWRASEKEYAEYESKKAKEAGHTSQNIKMNGKPVPDNRGIPANQQARRDLNKKLREQQKPANEKKEYQEKHPVLTKARRVAGKVHSVIQKTTSLYIEGSNTANRRHEAMRSSGRENVSGTWVSAPVRATRGKTANDNFSTLFNVPSSVPVMSGLMSGGGGFGIGSSLPKESTHTQKKKTTKRKKKPSRRRV